MMNTTLSTKHSKKSYSVITINTENIVLLCFIILSLVISLLPIHYGYFIDELYSIDLSKHLTWGYVALPPLMPLGLAITRFLFGESLFSIHIFSAIFGAIILVLTREIAKKFGANLFGQILALTCVLLASVSIGINARITYDNYNFLFWAFCLYFLVKLLNTENKKYWLYLGFFAGLGLMSKFTIIFLVFGVMVAMLFTKERKYFLCWQLWLGGIIALLIFSPYLLGTPSKVLRATLEYMQTYHQATPTLTLINLLKKQILSLNPAIFPIWLLGLYYFLFNKEGKKYRLFGFAYFIMILTCLLQQTKYYVIMPFYPVLIAGGAVFIEKLTYKFTQLITVAIVYTFLIVLTGLLLMPIARPILPPDILVKYLKTMHLFKPGSRMSTEHRRQGLLPQDYADRFGWEEMVAKIAQIYHALPADQRKNTVIITQNYGGAGAINLYRKKYNLPKAISPYLQYYFWGYGNLNQNSTLIIKGYSLKDIKKSCINVKLAAVVKNKYAMPDGSGSTGPIYICRGFKKPVQEIWKQSRNMRL